MSDIAVIYVITAIVSIAFAVLLISLARASSPAKIATEEKARKGVLTAGVSSNEPLRRTIYEEIKGMVDSKQSEQITRTITEVVNKEVEKRLNVNTQEMAKKYETLLKEKGFNEEIAWKKYKKVLTEKKDTEAVLHSIAEGLVVLDSKGKVVMMNPAAEKMLGVQKKDKIGRPIMENMREEQLISLVNDSSLDKENREIELVSPQDETKKTLRASTAVIENENGSTVGIVSVLSDITKQKELDQMKANFLSSVSHELRSPLVAMEKSISLILSKNTGPVNETQEQFLSIAERNIKRLGRLINDLLDLTKLEAGKLELKPQPASIESIIKDSVEGLNNWAQAKSINIERKIEEGIPLVNADPDRLVQVLTNLIGNAIKFTPNNGNITVDAVLRKDKQEVEVGVKDTGIGINKENLGKVFDKFYQVGERTPSDINGTGIGLSIAKEIVELHGGKIWVESEKGYGAKFIFTLPIKTA
jgi:PAS domain S-box-containing protein